MALLGLTLVATACSAQDRAERQERLARADADSLLPRLQELAGLRALSPIKVGYKTRAQVRQYVLRQLDKDEPPGELRGEQATYAVLGLIPDTLQLRPLLVDLYTEQVGGYYDPDEKTFYTVEGTPAAALKTVLAHELVHALQDQHTDLDSLVARKRGNDRQEAAQAAIEGQATAVMFAWAAEQAAGRQLGPGELPDLAARLRPALELQNSQFPVYSRAPRIIQRTLIFPYIGGASFVQALWAKRGAFVAPLDSLMPQSTEQILSPQRFLDTLDVPTELTLGPTPAPAWATVYENTLGEFETTIFLQQHLGAAATATGWDGDRFRVLSAPGGGYALVWYSVWDDAASADAFADAYRRTLPRRPTRRAAVERVELDGRPVVRVVDVPARISPDAVPLPPLTALAETPSRP